MTLVAGGLVAVHAHPDDESLATGALLATWAASGGPVTLVTCTRGERGEVIGDALAHLEGDGEALAAHRETELDDALAALGVADHVFLDQVGPPAATRYEDSGMAWLAAGRAGSADDVPVGAFVGVPLDEAAARLAHVLRSRRPDVVVTYEPAGGYGHPDHVRAHQVTVRALELAAQPDAGLPAAPPPVVLWAAQRADALRRGWRALDDDAVRTALGEARDGLTVPAPGDGLPSVAVPDGQVDLAVEIRPVRDRLLAALRAHATQVHAVRPVDGVDALVGCYALSNDVLAPVLPTEDYRIAGGPASALVWPTGIRPVA